MYFYLETSLSRIKFLRELFQWSGVDSYAICLSSSSSSFFLFLFLFLNFVIASILIYTCFKFGIRFCFSKSISYPNCQDMRPISACILFQLCEVTINSLYLCSATTQHYFHLLSIVKLLKSQLATTFPAFPVSCSWGPVLII